MQRFFLNILVFLLVYHISRWEIFCDSIFIFYIMYEDNAWHLEAEQCVLLFT